MQPCSSPWDPPAAAAVRYVQQLLPPPAAGVPWAAFPWGPPHPGMQTAQQQGNGAELAGPAVMAAYQQEFPALPGSTAHHASPLPQQQRWHWQQQQQQQQQQQLGPQRQPVQAWQQLGLHQQQQQQQPAGLLYCDIGLDLGSSSEVIATGIGSHGDEAAGVASTASSSAAVNDDVGTWLAVVRGRMQQLTPDWPTELRLAVVEAVLLEQQQQLLKHGASLAEGSSELLAARPGYRVPVGAAVLCHVAQQLPDAAYLTAARQLQEELQACWINGVPLPSVGGNLLLPTHLQSAGGSSTGSMLGLLNPYFNPAGSSNAAGAHPAVGCAGTASAAAAALAAAPAGQAGPPPGLAPHQLPSVSSEGLTFALIRVWGAAPKMTCLLSAVGGAAAAAAAAEARTAQQKGTVEGGGPACCVPLPQELLSWAAAGGVVAAVAGALSQLASNIHLGNSAGGLVAVTPEAGVDFGTNQVVVMHQQEPQQHEQLQQQQQRGVQRLGGNSGSLKNSIRCSSNGRTGSGDRSRTGSNASNDGVLSVGSCSSSSSSSGPLAGHPVVRELKITNIHASREVLLLNVCLAPEYAEWVSLWDERSIAVHPEQHMELAQRHIRQQEQQQQQQGTQSQVPSQDAGCSSDASGQQHCNGAGSVTADAAAAAAGTCGAGDPAAVLLAPGASYIVRVTLVTASSRKRSQAELGVISQMCVVTSASAAEEDAAVLANTAPRASVHKAAADTLYEGPAGSTGRGSTGPSGGGSSSRLPTPPDGYQVVVCGAPVAGGLVGQLADLQSVLRADAKPFISAQLRRLFVTQPSASSCGLAFLAAPTDLAWDVPMTKWHEYNGLSFLGQRQQPGMVPAVQAANLTLRRFRAMLDASSIGSSNSSSSSSNQALQAPLLTFGPPVLQQWQRLLLLEEGACERDMANYTVYNVRLAAAVFKGSSGGASATADGDDGARLRRYAICPWPTPPEPGAEVFTYRGPNLSALLGPARPARLAVISVPGLPENRPGLVTGDVVYVRLASALTPLARQALAAELTKQLEAVQKRYKQLCAAQALWSQLEARQAGAVELEAAGLVAAVDGSRCLLVMPDSFWLHLQLLHDYDTSTQRPGSWGTAPAAAHPLLVHAFFCFDRTGHGRMQAILPYLAASPRLLLPPGLLSGVPVTAGMSSLGGGAVAPAAAAAAVIGNELVSTGGIARPAKADQLLVMAASLQLAGGVALNQQQRLAVAALLSGGGVAAPYVLFGPPGTGKTVTLVEGVLQYRRAHPSARLLCCAPANYSADLLCSALAAAGVTPAEMLRLNDPRRPLVQAKTDTLPFCVVNAKLGCFSLEQGLKQAAIRPIVICSTITAGLLLPKLRKSSAIPIRPPGAPPVGPGTSWQAQQQQQLQQLAPTLQFDLVVVDEAGQGLAPEVLLPLSLAKPGGPIMLAGDPKQLGPVLRSATAAAAGLGVSLLDSWIQFWHSACPELTAAAQQQQQQQQHGGEATAAAGQVALCYGMLSDNYRSHKRLLDLPSRLFYGGKLCACASPAAVAPPPWSELMVPAEDGTGTGSSSAAAGGSVGEAAAAVAAPRSAVADEDALLELCPSSTLFVGVNGEQRQDGDAPSYYNPQEVLVLAELLTSLLGTPAPGTGGGAQPGSVQAAVSVNDIGVIATYRRQVQKIRLLLRQRGLGAVRVGTVDDYQGQEERIILISTTLSKPESLPPPLPDVSAIQQQHLQHSMLGGSQAGSWGLVGGISDVGFWRNPKRFNVAITRAKALLVVVGSPRVLAADDNWRQLLRHCVARGAYRGAGSSYLEQLLRVEAAPPGVDQLKELRLPAGLSAPTAAGSQHDAQQRLQGSKTGAPSSLEGLLADGGSDDEQQLALAVQAIAEAAQLGMGSAGLMYPQTLDEYYAACEEEQPWKVAL